MNEVMKHNSQQKNDSDENQKVLKIIFGIRAKLTFAVVIFLITLLTFTIKKAMDREIEFATDTSNIRALENILVLEKIFSDYFNDQIEFAIEKNKKYISEKLGKDYYISNFKNSKQFKFSYIYKEADFDKIPEYKKNNFNYVKFSYVSPFNQNDLINSDKWKDQIEKFETFWDWEQNTESRYQMLESRINDISGNIKKGFFNFQFLTINNKKAIRYFPLPAKLIWFQEKNYPFESELHAAINKNYSQEQKKLTDILDLDKSDFEFLKPATNEKKDRLLLKPLFVDFKPPLKDISIILFKILSVKTEWRDFKIDDDNKKKFSFFYEEKIQNLLKLFIKNETQILSELQEIHKTLINTENTIKDETVKNFNEKFSKNKNMIILNTGDYFKNKEWYSLNKNFQSGLIKKNNNLRTFLRQLRKEMYNVLIQPYNNESTKIKKNLQKIREEQYVLEKKIKNQKMMIYSIEMAANREFNTVKKGNGKKREEGSLPEDFILNELVADLEKLNQKQVEIEGNASSLTQTFLGKMLLPNLLFNTLIKTNYDFDNSLLLKDFTEPVILPNLAQEELRHRQLLPLRAKAGIVLKKLYNGIITTSVVFTAEEKIIQEKIHWWLTYGGIILSVGFILSFLFSTFFAREMKVIAEKTKIVGQGSLDVLFQVKRSDELGLISHELNGMVSGLREKKIMKSTFGRIVDPRVRDHLLEGGSELGGELKIATILFSDIRNFTTMSEILSPEDVVSLINRYFERMSTCINANEGIINKFIGDAILAVFGVPIAVENHAKKAVKTAIMMREANRELNIELRKEGLMEIKSAIGIHTGKVLAGNIGSKNRMEYTVIGDTVNTASRLEGLCKMYHKNLIISEQTLKNLPEKYQSAAKFIDDVVVKGKNKSVKIFSL